MVTTTYYNIASGTHQGLQLILTPTHFSFTHVLEETGNNNNTKVIRVPWSRIISHHISHSSNSIHKLLITVAATATSSTTSSSNPRRFFKIFVFPDRRFLVSIQNDIIRMKQRHMPAAAQQQQTFGDSILPAVKMIQAGDSTQSTHEPLEPSSSSVHVHDGPAGPAEPGAISNSFASAPVMTISGLPPCGGGGGHVLVMNESTQAINENDNDPAARAADSSTRLEDPCPITPPPQMRQEIYTPSLVAMRLIRYLVPLVLPKLCLLALFLAIALVIML